MVYQEQWHGSSSTSSEGSTVTAPAPAAPVTVTTTIGELVEAFHLYNLSVNKSKATLHWYQFGLKPFVEFFGKDSPLTTSITQGKLTHYRIYLIEKKLSVESVNNYLRALRALLRWATHEADYLDRCPNIQFLRADHQGPKESLTPDELHALLGAAWEESTLLLQLRARAIILVLYSTGLRASELCGAKWSALQHLDVDGEEAHVLIVEGAKRGGERPVVLPPDVWQAVKLYRDELARPHGRGAKKTGYAPEWLFVNREGQPFTVSGLRCIFRRLERCCAVHANPHKFRRSFATEWLNSEGDGDNGGGGGDIESLMLVGGWKDRKTLLKHYARIHTKTIVRAARRNGPLRSVAIGEETQEGERKKNKAVR